MLDDPIRTLAYENALKRAIEPGVSIVLDVGCGTGILSLMAARAGARHVFAVDRSLPPHVRELAACNGFGSDRITFIESEADHLSELRTASGQVFARAHILVSEWMGNALLAEAMLPAVLRARDRHLARDGRMLPSTATLFCAAFHSPVSPSGAGGASGVLGVDLSPLERRAARRAYFANDGIRARGRLLSTPHAVVSLDLERARPTDALGCVSLWPGAGEALAWARSESGANSVLFWFDVGFGSDPRHALSTHPLAPRTHWDQVLLFLPTSGGDQSALVRSDAVQVVVEAGETSNMTISLHRPLVPLPSPAPPVPSPAPLASIEIPSAGAESSVKPDVPVADAFGSLLDSLRRTSVGPSAPAVVWLGAGLALGAVAAALAGARSVTVLNRSEPGRELTRALLAANGRTGVQFIDRLPLRPDSLAARQLMLALGAWLPTGQPADLLFLGSGGTSWLALLDAMRLRSWFGEAFVAAFVASAALEARTQFWQKPLYGFDMSLLAPVEAATPALEAGQAGFVPRPGASGVRGPVVLVRRSTSAEDVTLAAPLVYKGTFSLVGSSDAETRGYFNEMQVHIGPTGASTTLLLPLNPPLRTGAGEHWDGTLSVALSREAGIGFNLDLRSSRGRTRLYALSVRPAEIVERLDEQHL